ncbi:RNA exonuclease 1 homolog [Gastrophryne carolinensis]
MSKHSGCSGDHQAPPETNDFLICTADPGFFQLLPCPFNKEPGGCPRPHCQFQHGSPESTEEPEETPSASPTQVLGKKMSELEKLNKAIEAVKNEVEESQKRLMLYKIKEPVCEVDCNSNILETVKDEQRTATKKDPEPFVISSKSKKLAHKYVVDRSCPATDLEYDPLLNYTAGFFGSTTKENESNCSMKRKSSDAYDDDDDDSGAASPIRLEIKLQESDDEDMLVIDAPPLEVVSRKQRPSKVCKAIEPETALEEAGESMGNNEIIDQCAAEAPHFPPLDVFDENIGSKHGNNVVTLHDLTTSCTDEQIKNLQVCSALEGINSYFPVAESKTKEEDILTSSAGSIHEQTDLLEEQVEHELPYLPPESMNLLSSESLDESAERFEAMASLTKVKEETAVYAPLTDDQQCLPETTCVPTKEENEVIILNSSDSDDAEESDTYSDSEDPMEECLRIFNEFNEQEAKKKAMQSICDEPETQEKGNDLLPGQKKRVAYPSAKSNVKESGSILVPYRGPTPRQLVPQRILRVQQQAVQISSAVRSGQTFVASSQKRISSCSSQAFHNFGQMVCVDLLEVQPVLPARSQLSGFIQGNLLTTTLKSAVPQRKTMPTTPVKITCRRKALVGRERSSKVPHEIRQRYVNSFVEEFLKESASVQEAFNKALAEEKAIYERCGSKNMYLNIAVNSLKKLRDQHSMSKLNYFSELTGRTLYNLLKEYLLSEDQLVENGYPRPNPDKPGSALIHNTGGKNISNDSLRRVCCRCGELYAVSSQGRHVRKEECTYHSGRVLRHKEPGGIETRYSCCEAAVGAAGCQMAKLHVHDGQKDNIDGIVKTFPKLQPSDGNPGIFSLDCEMCYTTCGLELTRISVVDHSLKVIYDTFVKPDNEIIDYNTSLSGVTEENLKYITTSIRDVQAILLNLFSADSILIGHSLENDLAAVKLIHDTVIDTSMVFPHRLGLPHKRALRNLIADYLRRIIQDNVGGHDSTEDATACMELMIWKVKEDIKWRR